MSQKKPEKAPLPQPVVQAESIFAASENIQKRIDELTAECERIGEERRLLKNEYDSRKREWEREERNFQAALGQMSSKVIVLDEQRRSEREKLEIANRRIRELRELGSR